MEDQVRLEAMKELEEVRRVRTVTLQGDEMREEVTKVIDYLDIKVSNLTHFRF